MARRRIHRTPACTAALKAAFAEHEEEVAEEEVACMMGEHSSRWSATPSAYASLSMPPAPPTSRLAFLATPVPPRTSVDMLSAERHTVPRAGEKRVLMQSELRSSPSKRARLVPPPPVVTSMDDITLLQSASSEKRSPIQLLPEAQPSRVAQPPHNKDPLLSPSASPALPRKLSFDSPRSSAIMAGEDYADAQHVAHRACGETSHTTPRAAPVASRASLSSGGDPKNPSPVAFSRDRKESTRTSRDDHATSPRRTSPYFASPAVQNASAPPSFGASASATSSSSEHYTVATTSAVRSLSSSPGSASPYPEQPASPSPNRAPFFAATPPPPSSSPPYESAHHANESFDGPRDVHRAKPRRVLSSESLLKQLRTKLDPGNAPVTPLGRKPATGAARGGKATSPTRSGSSPNKAEQPFETENTTQGGSKRGSGRARGSRARANRGKGTAGKGKNTGKVTDGGTGRAAKKGGAGKKKRTRRQKNLADAVDGECTVELEVVRPGVVQCRQVSHLYKNGKGRGTTMRVRGRGGKFVYRSTPAPNRINPVVGAGECLNALSHDAVVEALSSIASSECCVKDNGTWTFAIEDHDQVVDVLEELPNPMVTTRPVPDEVLEAFRKVKTFSVHTDFSQIPPQLFDTLLPFQLRGVQYALSREGRCIIADEMGLGKTFQGLAVAACYRDDWPLLVICPSSMRSAWSQELQKWLSVCPLDINIVLSSKDMVCNNVTIISYDLVPRVINQIEGKFKVVIADESHYLKNLDAKRTKTILPVLENADRAILLTGTPALSRPAELFPQLQAIGRQVFRTFKPFGYRYCNGRRGSYGLDFSGASHLKELHTLLQELAMIRRLKVDVMQELPQKKRTISLVDVDMTAELKQGMDELRGLERSIRRAQGVVHAVKRQKRELIVKLYQMSALCKVDSVARYIQDLMMRSDDPLLVFAHHHGMLDSLEKVFRSSGIKFIRIDGQTPPKDRQPRVMQFQSGRVQVALLSMTAGGQGITLTAASRVVFTELYWTPAILLQAEDRAHRIGQTKDVEIHYLLGRRTLDDSIWPLIEHKLGIIGRALDGDDGQCMDALMNEEECPELIRMSTEPVDGEEDPSCDTSLVPPTESMVLPSTKRVSHKGDALVKEKAEARGRETHHETTPSSTPTWDIRSYMSPRGATSSALPSTSAATSDQHSTTACATTQLSSAHVTSQRTLHGARSPVLSGVSFSDSAGKHSGGAHSIDRMFVVGSRSETSAVGSGGGGAALIDITEDDARANRYHVASSSTSSSASGRQRRIGGFGGARSIEEESDDDDVIVMGRSSSR